MCYRHAFQASHILPDSCTFDFLLRGHSISVAGTHTLFSASHCLNVFESHVAEVRFLMFIFLCISKFSAGLCSVVSVALYACSIRFY